MLFCRKQKRFEIEILSTFNVIESYDDKIVFVICKPVFYKKIEGSSYSR